MLAAGDQRTAIELVLVRGGVELHGMVSDLGGGPVREARVTASGATTETDDRGGYALWVSAGPVEVQARADGYAEARERGIAPSTIDLLLTPESSLAGRVIDAASGEPRAGLRVTISGPTGETSGATIAGADGAFRVTGLVPDRYAATVQDAGVFGRSDGSVRVGLGEHVDGVVVRVHRAYRVAGRVVAGNTPCAQPAGALIDDADQVVAVLAAQPDGMLVADGVRPGSYGVHAGCLGHQPVGEPRVVIGAADVVDQKWPVTAGATIRGRVTLDGAPIAGARVEARAATAIPRGAIGAREASSEADGTFVLRGLAAGRHRVTVDSALGHAPEVVLEVAAGATRDPVFTRAAGGTIRGVVVDPRGAPVSRVELRAWRTGFATRHTWFTGDDGRFAITGLATGSYRVTAARGEDALRIAGAPDGVRVAVATGTIELRIVVEAAVGAIRGSVVDATGAAIGDAYVSATREEAGESARGRVRWSANDRPALTATDGTFVLDRLAPGSYTILATRRGGGEAVAEHVAVGSVTRLVLGTTGSIAGTVSLAGGAPDELSITLAGADGFRRTDAFYRTGGRYTLAEVAPGSYLLRATTPGGAGETRITVVAGERARVDLALELLATVTGTLVELASQRPIPDVAMFVFPRDATAFSTPDGSLEASHVTDAGGRFTIRGARTGAIVVFARSRATGWSVVVPRVLPARPTIDLGPVAVVSPRVREGEPPGTLGITFRPELDLWFANPEIAAIDLAGPAAISGLVTGDVVTAVDGVDVRGEGIAHLGPLLRARAGTRLKLTVRRGVTVEITLESAR
ncbi:MAG: carboxypeptidase regulatory-like domain-containing protein [Kofleriaceae bacterium]